MARTHRKTDREPARTKAARTLLLVPAAQAAAELGLPYNTIRHLVEFPALGGQ